MTLGGKLQHLDRHVESVFRHDDAPLADRAEAKAALLEKVEAEWEAAVARDKARRAAALARPGPAAAEPAQPAAPAD